MDIRLIYVALSSSFPLHFTRQQSWKANRLPIVSFLFSYSFSSHSSSLDSSSLTLVSFSRFPSDVGPMPLQWSSDSEIEGRPCLLSVSVASLPIAAFLLLVSGSARVHLVSIFFFFSLRLALASRLSPRLRLPSRSWFVSFSPLLDRQSLCRNSP